MPCVSETTPSLTAPATPSHRNSRRRSARPRAVKLPGSATLRWGATAGSPFPEAALGVDPLCVIREALVQPHVGVILRRDVVAPPLVGALVDDDEVPLEAEARSGQVAAQIAIEVMIPVGDSTLMLHAEVRRLDELIAVGVPGIRTEPVLEAPEQRDRLLKLPARRVGMVVERPEVE